MTVRVRDAVPDDALRLGEVHVAAWRATYAGGLMPDELLDGLDPVARGAEWAAALDRPPSPGVHRLVGLDPQDVLRGFCVVGPARHDDAVASGEVHVLNVTPIAWGTGVGTALMDEGTRRLAAAGHDAAQLWVHPDNARARGFYRARGWHDEGSARTELFEGHEIREVRMVRRLVGGQPARATTERA